MRNFIKNIGYVAVCATLALTACSDDRDIIIDSLQYERALSPVDLKATIQNKVNVLLKWNKNPNAVAFEINIYEGDTVEEGAVPYRNAVSDTNSILVESLEGETQYTAVVVTIGDDGLSKSKESLITFKTDAEQIFYQITEDDLRATEVMLRWPAGEAVDIMYVTKAGEEAAVEYPVNSDEILIGAKTITGLVGETKYKVVMKRGTKTRGTIEFTTLIDLGGAIQVNPDDDLATMVEAASDGDVFALMPGEYNIAKLSINKSISIKGARPLNKPILISTVLRMSGGASLELKDLRLDGTGAADNSQMVVYDDGVEYSNLLIEDCEIYNYVKGVFYVSGSIPAVIGDITISNCTIHDILGEGGDVFDIRGGYASKFTLSNNTLYNVANKGDRDIIRFDNSTSTLPAAFTTIVVENNTFYKVSVTKRYLYVRVPNSITFRNNLITDTNAYLTNQSTTVIDKIENNNYFNAPNFQASVTTGAQNDTSSSASNIDPGFYDAEKSDFTVSNETIKDKNIGDNRWFK